VLPNKVFNFAVSKQFRSGDNTVNSAKDYEYNSKQNLQQLQQGFEHQGYQA
jgi:hypothetical protein